MSKEPTYVQLSDGSRLKVWMLGDTDPAKPLLIALHGAPGLSSHTEPLEAYSFLAKSCRVLIYDARGSGESDLQPPFTDERWIADIDELRSWAKADSIILAGGSYGAFLALGYALTFPQRLSGLVLRDAWACGPRGVLRALSSILSSSRITPDPERQVRLWSGNVQGREDGEKGLAEIVAIYTPEGTEDGNHNHGDAQPLLSSSSSSSSSSPSSNQKQQSAPPPPPAFEGAGDHELRWETHNAAFSHSVPRFDVRSRLCEVDAPTLVAVGRHDPICPVEESEEIHRLVKDSELAIFEKSGHNPPADEPERFQSVVDDFLKRRVFAQPS